MPLWIGGGLVALRALLAAMAWGIVALRPAAARVLGLGLDLRTSGILALVCVVLWWFIVARKRLAWVALMAVATIDAVNQLAVLSGQADLGLGRLLAAGLSVLTVLAVSSPKVRTWVSRGRVDPEVTLPDGYWRPHRRS